MENSKAKLKAKTTAKAKKPAASAKEGTTKKAKSADSRVNEDDIRVKAQEIYNDRVSKGVSGTPDEDWRKAEQQLKS